MHQKLYGFYLGGQFEVIKFALLTCLHITLLHWSHTSLTLKKITETTALSPDKELQASTDKNSNLQGSGGVKQVLLLVEPWDLSMPELYIEEYSTSERMITTWEPLCMNLERNIVWGGGGSWTISHLKTTSICSNLREKRTTSEEMILYILHLRTISRLRIISHLRSISWYLGYNLSLHALTLLECISVL